MRTIAHVDMDAFFAAVETLLHPEYAGKPLVVGGDPNGRRGVVATCSYEARKFGIRSAMPIREAVRRCPHAIFVRSDMAVYAQYSSAVFSVLESFSPAVEAISIDEAFLDMTGCEHFYSDLHAMGRTIKEKVKETTGLVASVGIAPNKFLAKMASDGGKPDGLVVVPPDRVQEYLDPLPVERLWGVGPRSAEKLRRYGVRTVGDLRRRSDAWARRVLGDAAGDHLFRLARGLDDRPVESTNTCKSMSRETTFDEDIRDRAVLRHVLANLTAEVGARMRSASLWAAAVTLKVRFPDFKTVTRRASFPTPVQDDDSIYGQALRLFEDVEDRPVRLIGVGVTDFCRSKQATLFDDDRKSETISRVMDRINAKFSTRVLQKGRERFVTPDSNRSHERS